MRPEIQMTGMRFYNLTVIRKDGYIFYGSRKIRTWICRCDCGKERKAIRDSLIQGSVKSCGCLNPHKTHGHTKRRKPSRTYQVWANIKARCYRTNHPRFPDWGGRGIKMCDRWRGSFLSFLSDVGEAPDGKSIDRIDNNGNYEPGNVRWATVSEQMRNKRSNKGKKYRPRKKKT